MSSVSGIRMPGLATGMDTELMIKSMLAREQAKIDRAKQNEQVTKWQQELYREVIKDIQNLQDTYFSITSSKSIMSSKAWNTVAVNSSNDNVISVSAGAGASNVDYSFDVKKLAQSAKASSSVDIDGGGTSLKDLGLDGDTTFYIKSSDGTSEAITIRAEDLTEIREVPVLDEDGNPVLDNDGNPVMEEVEVVVEKADTIDSLVKKINDASGGEIKASYSDMTGEFSIETVGTGSDSGFSIVDEDGNTSNALDFLGLKTTTVEINEDGSFTSETVDFNGSAVGSDSVIMVESRDGSFSRVLSESSNNFTIDGITYEVHTIGKAEITSKQDVEPVVDNMKEFIAEYNKIMDKIYSLVTQRTNSDYPPLTDEQKEEMTEAEIARWEEQAKQGLLRNDSEMRRFMSDMNKAVFGDDVALLNEMGIYTQTDYNKQGQLYLDVDKFTKNLQENPDRVYEFFVSGEDAVLERMRSTMNDYVGGSSSVFAKKAGIESTASVANNYYSQQLKRQNEIIQNLQRRMDAKEDQLYIKFGRLEQSMMQFNSQMEYFATV